jgi:tetratricopeptide (TPR) repeat protein
MPPRGDMTQLGRLMTALLTGDPDADADRPLNETAERLHAGRTVPARLNQLVEDLARTDPAQRPASMRDVLNALDQLEKIVEIEPPAAPALPDVAAAPEAPKRPAPPPAVRPLVSPAAVWVIVPSLVIGGSILLASILDRPLPPPGPAPAPGSVPAETVGTLEPKTPAVDPAAAPPTETPDPVAAARLAAARAAADVALGAYLAARREADVIGALEWGGAPFERGLRAAQEADRAFLDEAFADAARAYDEATTALREVVAGKGEVFDRLVRDGAEALSGRDAAGATAAFGAALLIDPDDAGAKVGLRRAGTLDELYRLLDSGTAHENENRLAFALVDYTTAVELDPESPEAAAALDRVRGRLAGEEFSSIMSRAMEAYHRGDYGEARARLADAERLEPGSETVSEALALVEEARLRQEVVRLRREAEDHELRERWQTAWNVYRQVLAIDGSIGFARDGKKRSEAMIVLDRRMARYLASPELLTQRGTREDARSLMAELEQTTHLGPRMLGESAELGALVRRANTPRRVVLRSDGKTEVDVYRVGRYGAMATRELELLPGTYTVVGHRTGYRDVRLTLVIGLDDEEASLDIVCTEPI